jgi:hypothetical protein
MVGNLAYRVERRSGDFWTSASWPRSGCCITSPQTPPDRVDAEEEIAAVRESGTDQAGLSSAIQCMRTRLQKKEMEIAP